MEAFSALNKAHHANAAHELSELCAELFRVTPISWFGFVRFFRNRDFAFLSTDPEIYEFYVDNECEVTEFGYRNVDEYVSGAFFCDLLHKTDDETELDKVVEAKFGLKNFICVIEKNKDYVDLYNFASDEADIDLPNFYLNNIVFIQNYIEYMADRLINIIAQNGLVVISVPDIIESGCESHYPNFRDEVDRLNSPLRGLRISLEGSIEDRCKNLETLNQRELSCLKFLLRGYTLKQIAAKLNLSIRTIDHYCESLKAKLECNSRPELIAKYANLI